MRIGKPAMEANPLCHKLGYYYGRYTETDSDSGKK